MFREKAQWQSIILGDILKLKHGYAFKSKYYSDDGHYILLTPGNFKEDGGLQLKDSKEKYFIGEFSEEYLLKRRDLLVVLTDLKQTAPILVDRGGNKATIN